MKRRAAALWFVLFAVYASTIGLNAFGNSQYAGDEPHYLLTAKSIVDSGQIDVTGEYRDRAYRSFYAGTLLPHGRADEGQAERAARRRLPAADRARVRDRRARRASSCSSRRSALSPCCSRTGWRCKVVPDPWALGATLAVGLSPPLLAYSTAVYPELAAAARAVRGGAARAAIAGPAFAPQRILAASR